MTAAAKMLQRARAQREPQFMWLSLRFQGRRVNHGPAYDEAREYLDAVCDDDAVGGPFPEDQDAARLAFDLATSAALSDEAAR